MKTKIGIWVERIGFSAVLNVKDAVKLLSLYKNVENIGSIVTMEYEDDDLEE